MLTRRISIFPGSAVPAATVPDAAGFLTADPGVYPRVAAAHPQGAARISGGPRIPSVVTTGPATSGTRIGGEQS